MKFILSHAIVPEAMQLLDGCETKVLNTRDMAENKADIADADAIVARISHVNAEAIEAAKNLKVIGRTGVGYDMVDVQAATARGIPVVLTPGANNRSVAEHTVALLFALSKNLVEGHNEQMKGNYAIRNKGVAFELLDKTIMVLGLGAIGGEVARLCKAIGMNVLGYDPFLPEDPILPADPREPDVPDDPTAPSVPGDPGESETDGTAAELPGTLYGSISDLLPDA